MSDGNGTSMDQGGGTIQAVDEADFDARVLERSHRVPVLVDFWAGWCAPCITLAPVLERLAAERAGRLEVVKVEVDAGDNMRLAGHYRLRGFPTVILFRDGLERCRFAGSRSLEAVRRFVDECLAGSA